LPTTLWRRLDWLGMLPSDELADRLRLAIGRLARKLRQQSLGGLSPSQASVLATLERRGAMNMGELAETESITKPSASGIVGHLLDGGLVSKSSSPLDRRSAIVGITPRGKVLLEERRAERSAYLTCRISDLDSDRRALLEQAVVILEEMVSDR
jgi:DNA-binding MarR family transcriptional regulator